MKPYRYALAFVLALLAIASGADAQCSSGRCPVRQYHPATQYTYAPALQYAPAPTAYQLADASGKAWQHADAVYLASWVAERNKTLATAQPASPQAAPAQVSGRKVGDLAIYQAGEAPLKGSRVRLVQSLGGFRWKVETTGIYPVTFESIEYYLTPISASVQSATPANDSTGFLSWLNAYRARFYRNPVTLDPALSADAAASNAAMRRFGFGHHFRYAPNQKCVGMGSLATIEAMWQADPPHNAWLLKPGLTAVGVAFDGQYATFSAR